MCTGNQARSPLAEALFRARVAGLPVEVGSLGTEQLPPSPALRNAVSVGVALGVDLTAHQSRPLAVGDLRRADLVIGFEYFHVAAAVVEAGASRERSFLVRELAGLLEESFLSRPCGVGDARPRIEALHRLRVGRPMSPSLAMPDPAGRPYGVFEALGAEIDGFTRRLAIDLLGVS